MLISCDFKQKLLSWNFQCDYYRKIPIISKACPIMFNLSKDFFDGFNFGWGEGKGLHRDGGHIIGKNFALQNCFGTYLEDWEVRPKLLWCCVYENNNPSLTEREGRTGEYWPEVVAVRTERSEVRTKTVRMAKSRPRKNQSERSILPCHIIMNKTLYIMTEDMKPKISLIQ